MTNSIPDRICQVTVAIALSSFVSGLQFLPEFRPRHRSNVDVVFFGDIDHRPGHPTIAEFLHRATRDRHADCSVHAQHRTASCYGRVQRQNFAATPVGWPADEKSARRGFAARTGAERAAWIRKTGGQ